MAWERAISHTSDTAAYWDAQSKFSDSVVVDAGAATLSVSQLAMKFSRVTPAGTREDLSEFTTHHAFIAGGGLYSRLSDAQKATVEGIWGTWWTTVKALCDSGITLVEYAWHDLDLGDAFYGPADRVTTASVAGTLVADRMPDQLAVDVTLRTASRKHWGRFYVVGIGTTKYEKAYGRPANTTCDSLATATRTAYLAEDAASIALVVCSKQHQGILTVDEIHCDNVPDVIRRRRPKQASYRKSYAS